mgnify:CR=1 FL=1|jgi:hypothetical protein
MFSLTQRDIDRHLSPRAIAATRPHARTPVARDSEKTRRLIHEAVAFCIESFTDDGEPIPDPN